MKKFLIILIIILLVLFGVFYFWWNNKPSIQVQIPINSKAIICVDFHNLRNTVLAEMPGEVTDLLKEDSSSFKRKLEAYSIVMPNYLIGYYYQSNWIFELPIKNQDKLKNGLLNDGFTKEGEVYTIKNNKIKACIRESKVYFGLGKSESQEFEKIIKSEKKYLSEDDQLIQELESSTNHISLFIHDSSYTKSWSNVSVNFLDNEVKIEGEIALKEKLESEIVYNNIPESFAYIKLYDELNVLNNQKITGQLNFNGFTTLIDTVVSFDYDENFEMVEKKELNEIKTPKFAGFISKNKTGGVSLFGNDSLIKIINQDTLFTGIPLYLIKAEEREERYILTKNMVYGDWQNKSNQLLDVFVDIKNTPWQDFEIPHLNFLTHLDFSSFHLTISAEESGLMVDGKLKTENKENHTLSILKKMLIH